MAKIKTRTGSSHHTRPRGVAKHHFEKVYWPYIPVVLTISILLPLSGRSGALQAAVHHPAGKVLSYATSMSIGGLLADTNAARVSNGVAALSLNDKLDAAAQAKADDMAARDYWSHYTPEGNPPWVFVTNQGYSYIKLGENLATGFNDEQSTVNGWMASPPHRENLLDPAFKDVGFGYANNSDYTAAGGGPQTIVVAFYGEPPAAPVPARTVPPAPAASVRSSTTTPTPPAETSPAPAAPAPATTAESAKPKAALPATTKTTQQEMPVTKHTSWLQLAAPGSAYAAAATSLSIIAAVGLGLFWASRHLLALHKFLIRGERYAVRHPLTDIGLIVIAALLFILSRTAGLIQ